MAGKKKNDQKARTRRDYPIYCMWHIAVGSEQKIKSALQHFDLSNQDWRVIFTLHDVDGLSISDLSQEILIEPSVLSRILASLESRDIIRRKKDRADKRRTLLHLTAKGKKLYKDMMPIFLRQYESIMQGLSKKEREHLMDLVNRIKDNIYRSPYLLETN